MFFTFSTIDHKSAKRGIVMMELLCALLLFFAIGLIGAQMLVHGYRMYRNGVLQNQAVTLLDQYIQELWAKGSATIDQHFLQQYSFKTERISLQPINRLHNDTFDYQCVMVRLSWKDASGTPCQLQALGVVR